MGRVVLVQVLLQRLKKGYLQQFIVNIILKNMKIEKKLSKFEDAMLIYFKLSYFDLTLYSVTMEDAYRTPWCKLMSQEELDEFLKEW